MERMYKLNDLSNAIKLVHPDETRMSKMTMIRYLKNGIGEYELQDNKHGGGMYLVPRQTILDMADEYNRTRAIGRVDIQSVLDILDGLDTPEVKMQKLEEELAKAKEELKEKHLLEDQLKLKEELLAQKSETIQKLRDTILTHEEQNRTLLAETTKKEDKMKNYLLELDKYNSTNPIVRVFKGIKKPKLDF